MHVDDPTDNGAIIFNDTMQALGLNQHVTKPTHRLGNILDLIYTETDNSIKVGLTRVGSLMSDHHSISTSLNIKKPPVTRETVTVRKTSAITADQLCSEYGEDLPFDSEDLDKLTVKFEDELKQVFDVVAPMKKVTLNCHKRQPWYDHDVKSQHAIIRNREQVWLKYKVESNWTAFKVERNIYNKLIIYKRRQVISKIVNDLRGDTKALYKLTTNLTSQTTSNPMSHSDSNEKLAEDFASFFLEKLRRSGKGLVIIQYMIQYRVQHHYSGNSAL